MTGLFISRICHFPGGAVEVLNCSMINEDKERRAKNPFNLSDRSWVGDGLLIECLIECLNRLGNRKAAEQKHLHNG